jgi:hypothetical protein
MPVCDEAAISTGFTTGGAALKAILPPVPKHPIEQRG